MQAFMFQQQHAECVDLAPIQSYPEHAEHADTVPDPLKVILKNP